MVMRFLICGVGSIGQRHYKNLSNLGHALAIYRSRKTTTPFIDKFLAEHKPANVFYDLDEALRSFKPDGVFVTNPNSRHIEIALPAARAGSHLFIEKPVSHTLAGLEELKKIAKDKSLKVMVGYNLRFHPLLRRMKQMVDSGWIGKPIAAQVETGENIEDWHPWEDYRTSYAPYKGDGGGVVLCFSHDIDYLYWFFGMPKRIFAVGGKMTPLTGDAEDVTQSVWEFDRRPIVSLHLDYWQRPPRRVLAIIGTAGKLTWDYYMKILTFKPREPNRHSQIFCVPPSFDRNDMFVEEVQDFIESIRKDREPLITLNQGIDVLKIALEIKRSINF